VGKILSNFSENKEVFIDSDFITLTQFLKNEGIISTGGQAKFFLFDQEVFVNGELEERRGRKLYPEDTIEVLDQSYIIKHDSK